MPVIRYISDLHFDHANVIKFDNRPFETIEEMNAELIRRWNETVAKDDITYIIGDFCWYTADRWEELLKQLNGNKVIIRGNHDLKQPPAKIKRLVQDYTDYKEITDNYRHVILCHYPIPFYKGSYAPWTFMLCGHVHNTRENDFLQSLRKELISTCTAKGHNRGNIFNCWCGFYDYRPVTLDELIEYWKYH